MILKGRQSTIKELIEQNLYDELGVCCARSATWSGCWRASPCAVPARAI